MKEELIKKILSKDLKNISAENFNEKIIQKLDLKKKKKRMILFKESEIIKVFILVFLFVLIANLDIVPTLNHTAILIGTIICITPLFLIAYNKIYQSTLQNLKQ